MRMIDIIEHKRDGRILTNEEINFFITNYVDGKIPDYQVSALLMAILFRGMSDKEIFNLTNDMLHSGDIIDLSKIKGVKVDKHSTGGVGDKTSLVLGPLVASCGAKLAKMSGRGLGHTGGTLDKMESIPGMQINISEENFISQVNKIGMAIVGQTGHLVPADKKLYALRDVTGTVDSLPLIASSIMSKKLASGSDSILLDVKVGSGAFMKTLEMGEELAKTMVSIGKYFKKDTRAILTDMDEPLGLAVGNNLEVIEAINTLKGNGPKDLTELCIKAGAIMLLQAKICTSFEEGEKLLQSKIENGEAFKKFVEFVEAQGGDISYVLNTSKFEKAKYEISINSNKSGYITKIDALEIGEFAMKLGAGREKIEDKIDYSAGIILSKKIGDFVNSGDELCKIYTNKENYEEIIKEIKNSFIISENKPENRKIIYKVIS